MKNILLTLCISFLIAGTACAQKQQEGFLIKGKISGLTGKSFDRLLCSMSNKLTRDLPSITIGENGTFEYRDTLDVDGVKSVNFILMTAVTGGNGSMGIRTYTKSFYVRNGDIITIEGDKMEFPWLKVSGNKYNDQLTEFILAIKDQRIHYNKLLEEQKTMKRSSDPDLEKRKSVLPDKIESARKQFVKALQNFLSRNPNNHSNDLVLSVNSEALKFDELQLAYNTLRKDHQKSIYGKNIVEKLRSKEQRLKTEEGKNAPDFAKIDKDGNLIRLSDFKGKKYVLLDFWGSW